MNKLVPKKVSRLTKILLSIIIGAGLIIILVIKSGLPHEMLKSYLQFQFKQTYNIPLKINKIEGNIFQSLVLKNISIHTPNQHPILNIPKLQLSYPPHQLIFKNKRLSSLISNITITNPTLFLLTASKMEPGTSKQYNLIKKKPDYPKFKQPITPEN